MINMDCITISKHFLIDLLTLTSKFKFDTSCLTNWWIMKPFGFGV